MNCKKLFMLSLLLSFGLFCKSQNLTSTHFRISDKSTNIKSIEMTFDDTIIYIDSEGNIYGLPSNRKDDFQYASNFDGENRQGKIKSIGNMKIDYYDKFDMHEPIGKVKSIGNIKILYNNKFDIQEKFGTIKSNGNIKISYYNTFDINDPIGKVKSIGNVKIDYFNKFDSADKFGNIKSIKGNSKLVYVTK
jgi:hypothetical protein